MNYQPLTLH